MNKKLLGVLFILITLTLCGCGNDSMTLTNADSGADVYGTYEWVSPDGVHYWVYSGYYRYGIAPRYDRNGELVID